MVGELFFQELKLPLDLRFETPKNPSLFYRDLTRRILRAFLDQVLRRVRRTILVGRWAPSTHGWSLRAQVTPKSSFQLGVSIAPTNLPGRLGAWSNPDVQGSVK